MRKHGGLPKTAPEQESRMQTLHMPGERQHTTRCVDSQICCMNELQPGQSARVLRLSNSGSIRRRLLDIGLVENTRVECRMKSPGGGPAAYLIRGAVIAIRRTDGADIFVLREKEGEYAGQVKELDRRQKGDIIWD